MKESQPFEKETKMAEQKIYYQTAFKGAGPAGGCWTCTVLEPVDDGSDNLRPLAEFNLTCDLTLYKQGQLSLDPRVRPKQQPLVNECLSRIADAIKKQPELMGVPHNGLDTPF
jgi:hypothetical protein